MKKQKLQKLALHKKSISKLQTQEIKGQLRNEDGDDGLNTWGCTWGLACWSIVCNSDECTG
jgi:hypothetical protein